jgi:hypothetical protein
MEEQEITGVRYVREIGLICTTFTGVVKFFDGFNFLESWSSSNKQRLEEQHSNITSFDVSIKLGLMVTGGHEGRILLIDPYALGILEGVQAHPAEIINLYIYEE